MEKLKPMSNAGANTKWCDHYGKEYSTSSKDFKKNYHVIQQFHFWVYIKELKTEPQRDSCTPTFLSALFTIGKR